MNASSSLLLVALVALLAVSVSAVSTGSTPTPTGSNPCERLTSIQFPGQTFTAANELIAMQRYIVAVAAGSGSGTSGNVGLFFNPTTVGYFNSSINYRAGGPVPSPYYGQATPNFITDSVQQGLLVNRLSAFFGDALGCGTNGVTGWVKYSPYVGTVQFNQYKIHANMNITGPVFSAFVNEAVKASANQGANPADQNTVSTYLSTFARNNVNNQNEICTQAPSCTCAPGVTGSDCGTVTPTQAASSAPVSVVAMLMAAILAVIAMRR